VSMNGQRRRIGPGPDGLKAEELRKRNTPLEEVSALSWGDSGLPQEGEAQS
jgi:hypothetical protein